MGSPCAPMVCGAEKRISRSTRFSRRSACASFAPPSQRREAIPSAARVCMAMGRESLTPPP